MDNTLASIYDILYSVTQVKDTELANNIIRRLEDSNILDTDEQFVLNTFKNLQEELEQIPSSGVLVSRDPGFSTARLIQESSLEDITKLFIISKRKQNLAAVLLNTSAELSQPGANFDALMDKISEAQIKYNLRDFNENKINTSDLDQIKSKLHEVKEEVKGIPFGIDFVDQLYPGITPGSYNIVAGYTGSLKTTLTLNMCYMGLQHGYNTLYISLEVSKDDVIMNLMALHSLTMGKPVKRSEITKLRYKEPEKFDEILDSLYSLPGKIEVYDETDIDQYSVATFDEIIRKTDKMFKDKFKTKLHHIVLDHAQLLKFDQSKMPKDPYMVVNYFASYFRQKAAKDNYAVTMVSQTSRNGYDYAVKHGGQYLLTGLAEGNELERGSTFVISVYLSDSLKASGQAQIQILKNRYGETMLEPQTTQIRPEYYLVGDGYNATSIQIGPVFDNDEEVVNPFNTETITDLDSLLGGM